MFPSSGTPILGRPLGYLVIFPNGFNKGPYILIFFNWFWGPTQNINRTAEPRGPQKGGAEPHEQATGPQQPQVHRGEGSDHTMGGVSGVATLHHISLYNPYIPPYLAPTYSPWIPLKVPLILRLSVQLHGAPQHGRSTCGWPETMGRWCSSRTQMARNPVVKEDAGDVVGTHRGNIRVIWGLY